ncbi:hypothetical protein [Lentzea sp. NPDC055074]
MTKLMVMLRTGGSFWAAYQLKIFKKMDKDIPDRTISVYDQFASVIDKGFLW